MKQVTILVTGPFASGKTAITQIISNALNNEGLPTIPEEDRGYHNPERLRHVINSLREKGIQIEVKQVQTQREGNVSIY